MVKDPAAIFAEVAVKPLRPRPLSEHHLKAGFRPAGEDTYLGARIRGRKRKRRQARVGAPDRALTPNAGMAAISEWCVRLGMIGALDAAVGPVKQRNRGFGAGELLTGIAAAQLAIRIARGSRN
jgi:hypothetical protein